MSISEVQSQQDIPDKTAPTVMIVVMYQKIVVTHALDLLRSR